MIKTHSQKISFFFPADPISGGRGVNGINSHELQAPEHTRFNQFQGRYIMRHYWRGKTRCKSPQFNQWGRSNQSPSSSDPQISVVTERVNITQDPLDLNQVIRTAIPKWGIQAKPAPHRSSSPP